MALGLSSTLSKTGFTNPVAGIVTDSLVLKHNYAAGGVVPVSDGAAFFDGTDDYITIADDSTLDLFKNALTIEKAFNEEDLVANYSTNNCKWCGFKDECDAWKNKAPMKYNKFNKNFISIDVLSDAV